MLMIFDLDETLINVSGHHIASMEYAVKQVWKNDYPEELRQLTGVPQGEKLRVAAKIIGFDSSDCDVYIKRAMGCMTSYISDELPQDLIGFVIPGAINLLSRLHIKNGIHMALATGTLSSVVKILLERSELQKFFPVGAYGDEGATKFEIMGLACRRAQEFYAEESNLEPMAVVGDQISDILAGKELNMFTVGVTSGRFSRRDLERAGADIVFSDLLDAGSIIRTILSNSEYY